MISWKSVLKYLNCLKFTKDGKKLNFDDFVEKNTGIQTYIYKIRNILFKMDPTFGCQSVEGKFEKKSTFGLGCLTSLSAIFQLYHGGQFYWWRKPDCRRKPPTCRKSLTNFTFYVVSSTPRHQRGSNSQL
jgi:hypothetical protein